MVVTKSPRARLRRLVPWLVGGLLIGVLGSFFLGRSFVANGRLADAMAAADRDNPYWRLDDLLAHRQTVPDPENSAVVLAKVNELLPGGWSTLPTPATGSPTSGNAPAWDAYERIQELRANVRVDDADARVLRAELEAHQETLRLARTVAGHPRGRHELVLSPGLYDTPLLETQSVRRVARLLAADAALRAEDGDPDGALESCRAILATARSIGDEPMLISSLVRIAIDSLAIRSAGRVLAQGEPSDAALDQLQRLIFDEKAQPLLYTGINGERAFLIELIRRVEAGKVKLSTIIRSPAQRWIASVAGNFGEQQALALEWMNEAAEITRRPTFEQPALSAKWDGKISRFYAGQVKRLTLPLPHLLTPALTSGTTAFLRSQAELGSMAILIAAERQRRRTGTWPASIQEIDPSILPEAPVDPYSGKPFHIECRDGQLFIYSIGPNGRDEHGEYDPKRWQNGGGDDVGARGWDLKLRRRPAGESKGSGR